MNIGIIGLGIGGLSVYGQESDRITFYELDPKVTEIAKEYFTYLKEAKGDIDIIHGDGRISLSRQEPNNYDLLYADAFNSDSIPVHLLTKEAIEMMDKHTQQGGLMIFNVSNRYLSIFPVLKNIADELGLFSIWIRNDREKGDKFCFPSEYVVLSHTNSFNLYAEQIAKDPQYKLSTLKTPKNRYSNIWSDNYSNLLPLLTVDMERKKDRAH